MVVAGQAWRYDYDEAGRMVTIEERAFPNEGYGLQAYGTTGYGGTQSEGPNLPGSVYYEYDATNKLTKKTLGNGCYTYFAYDRANRLSQMLSYKPDSTPLAYFEYTYDAASRITQCQREDGTMIYYEYDQASRLTREVCQGAEMSPTYDLQWFYDAAGNRIRQNWSGDDTYYTYDEGNTLIMKYSSSLGHTYYSYDSRGNCTLIQDSEESIYFEYNHANLVTSIHYNFQIGNEPVWNYFYYDSKFRRYAMQDSKGLAYFTWDSNGLNLLEERDTQSNITAQYTHGYTPIEGIGSLVAAKKEVDGCTYYQYPIYDHRGTVVKLVDENSEIIGEGYFDAWGVQYGGLEPASRFRYQSNWIILGDYGECLFLSPTRIYSARDGRFLQRDPLGFVDGLNLYQAFSSNPNTFIDPRGMFDPFVFTPEQEAKQEEKNREEIRERKRIFIQILKKTYKDYKDYFYLDIEKIEKAVEKTTDVVFESIFYAFISNFGGTGGADSLYHPLFKEIYYPHGKNANRTGTQEWIALHEAIHALFDQELGYFNVDNPKDHLFLQTYLEQLVLGNQGNGIVEEILSVLNKIEYYEKAARSKNQPAFDLNNICSQINRIKERLKELEIFERKMRDNQIFQKRKQIVGFKQNLSEIFSQKIPQSIIDECKKLVNKCGE